VRGKKWLLNYELRNLINTHRAEEDSARAGIKRGGTEINWKAVKSQKITDP
jgi:hypothetical protein